MCVICSQGRVPASSLFHDGSTGIWSDSAYSTKPVFTDEQIIAYLKTQWGGAQEGWTRSWDGSTISYSIPDAPDTFITDEADYWVPMSETMKATARFAFEIWDDLVAIDLVENDADSDIRFGYADKTRAGSEFVDNGGTYALSAYTYGSGSTESTIMWSEIWLNNDWTTHDEDLDLTLGGYGLQTYLHEIGHSLGLSHPGSYNGGGSYGLSAEFAQDTHTYTVMSYWHSNDDGSEIDHWGSDGEWYYAQTPMLYDIAALQSIYGADVMTRAGDTVYGFNSTAGQSVFDFSVNYNPMVAVWDGGGVDTLDVSGYSTIQLIDLTPGSYSNIGYMEKNLAIAFGATIENVIGGSGADTIIGNLASNRLDGGAGTDTLVLSGAAKDYHFVGTGWDFSLTGNGGIDRVLNFEYVKVGGGSQVSVTSFLASIEIDDFADTKTDPSTPVGSLVVGGTASGSIETRWDADVFAVSLTAGQRYKFSLIGLDGGIRTLTNNALDLFNSSWVNLGSGSSWGTGKASEIIYLAGATGVFYLSVGGFGADDFGSYKLTAVKTGSPPIILSGGGGETCLFAVMENETAVMVVSATDPEGTKPTYSIRGGVDASFFTINAVTGALAFKSAPNYELPSDYDGDNIYEVVVEASDGSATDTQTIEVMVGDRNEAPSAGLINLGAIAEDGSRVITAAELLAGAFDPEGRSVTVTSLSLTSGKGTLASNGNGTWTYKPAPNDDTAATFKYIVSDGEFSASATAVLDLTPVNDAPVFGIGIPDKIVAEESLWTFQIPDGLFTDADNSILSYVATLDDGTTLPEWLSFNAQSRVFNGTPPKDFNGSLYLKVEVSDGSSSVWDTFVLTVTAINDAPIVSIAVADQIVPEEEFWLFTIPPETFADVDNGHLTYSASLGDGSALPTWLFFDFMTGTFFGTPPKDFFGSILLKVSAWDGTDTVSDTFVLTVTNVADAPVVSVAIPDRTVAEDTAWSYQVSAGTFSDPDGGTLSYSAYMEDGSALPTWLKFNEATRTFSGTPPANHNGILTLKVVASDGTSIAEDTFKLTISEVNDAPVAGTTGNSAYGYEDMPITGSVPAGTDIDSGWLYYELVAPVSGLVLNSNGSFTYTPPADLNGTVAFQYRVVDSAGAKSAPQTFVLSVGASNDAPVALPANLGSLSEDSFRSITSAQLLSSVSDVDRDTLTITSLTLTSGNGQLVANGNGTWTYTPASNDSSSATFSYTVTDGPATVTSTATLDLVPVNDAPVAGDDVGAATEDGMGITIDVLANDLDVDIGDVKALVSVNTAGTQGIVNIIGGKITYSTGAGFQALKAGEIGTDTFTYIMRDGAWATKTATVTITVVGTNDKPVVYLPIDRTVEEGTGVIAVSLLQNVHDPDAGETATLKIVGVGELPDGLTLSADGSSVIVDTNSSVFESLPKGQTKTFEVTYKVEDINGAQVDHNAVITVVGTNDAPSVNPTKMVEVDEDAETAPVVIHAADLDEDSLSYAVKGGFQPTKGDVSIENGAFVYRPHANEEGADSFVIVVSDGKGGSVEQTVNVAIRAINDAPVSAPINAGMVPAVPGSTLSIQLDGSDADPSEDPDTLTYTIVDALPSGLGTLTLAGGRNVTFQVGDDFADLAQGELREVAFSYKTTDKNGVDSNTATVKLWVSGVNDAPTAQDVTVATAVGEDGFSVEGQILADDLDSDDDAASLMYEIVTRPAKGTVLLSPNGSFVFSAGSDFQDLAEGEERQVTFSYLVKDRHGAASEVKTATVTVVGSNDAPSGPADVSGFGTEGTGSFILDLLQGSVDPDAGGTAGLRVVELTPLPAGIRLSSDGRSLIVDTNAAAFDGLASGATKVLTLGFKVADALGAQSQRTATITIAGVNDAPNVSPVRSIVTNEETPLKGVVIGGYDPDSDALTYWIKPGSEPQKGFVWFENGTFTYHPAAEANGTDAFTIVVSDGRGGSVEQRVEVSINPVNDAPTRVNLSGNVVAEGAGSGTTIGWLSGDDIDGGDRLSFSLVDDAGGRFAVDGSRLVVANGAALDFETTGSHQVTVRVADGLGGFLDKSFTVSLSDVMETITGSTGKNTLSGGYGADNILGGKGNDVLKGGSGNDRLDGGYNNDVLYGGAGQDAFVFKDKLSSTLNRDKIADFIVADDSILLDNAVFKKVGKGSPSAPQELSKSYFVVGSKAKDKNDYVIYDNKKGVLYYDVDGSGKGAAIQVATLSKNLKMTYQDFLVI